MHWALLHEVMLTLFIVLWCVRSHHCALPSCVPVPFLLVQSLVMRYGKESDKVATAVSGVRKMVDKVRGGEGRCEEVGGKMGRGGECGE